MKQCDWRCVTGLYDIVARYGGTSRVRRRITTPRGTPVISGRGGNFDKRFRGQERDIVGSIVALGGGRGLPAWAGLKVVAKRPRLGDDRERYAEC